MWANVAPDSYDDLWSTDLGPLTLGQWIDEGLMAIFFFVVGLEIKREVVRGELREPRRAALPVAAAVGGMVVPAVIYTIANVGTDGLRGWAIPTATDIAFALGVVVLLGDRVPRQLRLFLLTLAIVDDIGAIALIAVFYAEDLSFAWLVLAVAGLGFLVLLERVGWWTAPLHLVIGVGIWWATYKSGISPTIAGVALALVAPVADDLEARLHPWSSYLIVPLFALANAGISLSGGHLSDALTSTVTVGIVVGLVVGKPAGIVGAAWLAEHNGWAERPPGMTYEGLLGIGAVGGIGFTVSLLITDLAFEDAPALAGEAKIGILAASVLAAGLGALVLRRSQPG